MTGPTPHDYTPKDGWDDGTEICPHCEKVFGMETGYHGPVFDTDGNRYTFFLDTEPGEGPYYCPDCFVKLDNNRRAQENKPLEEFR